MRLASYNVENLFDRAKVMNLDTWEEGRETLDNFARLNKLFGQVHYSDDDKEKMIDLIVQLGLEKRDEGPFVILRRNRGRLLRRTENGIEIIADGRIDWAGSLELLEEPIPETAMQNTARAIGEMNADVLAVIEAENRPSLMAFNLQILPAVDARPYRHVMLVDGNDSRGIDVGLLTREDFPIGAIRSHADERIGDEPLFSRDCPDYEVRTPSGKTIHILINHFKSKGYGIKRVSDERRRRQAMRVAEIYRDLVSAGEVLVAVVGDLNDTPDSAPLRPLLDATDLRDVFESERFDDGGRPGTYGSCTAANKIDYILLSPDLFSAITGGGVFRKAMWPGVRPKKWPCFDEIKRPEDAGSDHAGVFVDLNV